MARHFSEPKLVIASHNAGKVREIGDLLRPFDTDVVSAGDLNIEEPIEDGATFVANASLKAHASARASGLPALADDSGLAVVALDGDPGIFSARWGGPDRDFNMAMQKVEDALQASGSEDRRAYFVCALCLAWPDGHEEIFEGRVDGTLVWPQRGDHGFGYDPIFLPEGGDLSFGEMDPDAKHAISHRADAFRQLVDACF
jgi:XTP/dITP diphosphohydrolase